MRLITAITNALFLDKDSIAKLDAIRRERERQARKPIVIVIRR